MGLSKFIKNKVNERVVNYKAERAHQREDKLAERNEYEKGRKIGAMERGKIEGSGRLTESQKYSSRSNSGGRSRPTQRVTGQGGFTGTMQKSDSIFGWSGGGPSLGFGGDEPRRSAPPTRITEFNPRTGKTRTIETLQPKQQESNDVPFGIGLDGFGSGGFGGSSGNSKKNRREPHPYEF